MAIASLCSITQDKCMLLSHSGEHGVAAMCDIIQGRKKSVPLHIA